jgi:methylmalonyl-CoA mutase C-terminal domain/subunit
MAEDNRKRILIAKLGLDGHDRGAKALASILKQEGYEVIYLGMYNTPEVVAKTAIQEDVDLIGISFLSGEHLILTPDLMEQLKIQGMEEIPVIIGGIFPPQDVEKLLEMGVHKVFRGAMVRDVTDYLDQLFSNNVHP